MILGLIGNQNSGKTTLFNQLTGSNQHVGNFPGVTVEQKSGQIKGHDDMTLVDLPGIYSLSPYTSEEIVTRDFILKQHPDAIINIADATNIERNLYLTLQLTELNIPMVLALNMMDELRGNGGSVNIKILEEELGIPVVPISAVKNEGISELIDRTINIASRGSKPKRVDFCEGALHRCLHAIEYLIEDHAARINIPNRFAATKLIEGDTPTEEALILSDNEKDAIEHCIVEMETALNTDREAALADMRYSYIESLCRKAVVKPVQSKEALLSAKIDTFLTHKYLALPIFLSAMFIIFWATFGPAGSFLSDLLNSGISFLSSAVSDGMFYLKINPVMQSLVTDGIFSGVGTVLSFVPYIIILFFFLSLLEDTGYMARISFIMDKPFRKLGLSGRSFVPLLIGFGCSVPAIMSSRTLSSDRDRRLTVLLIPFISCSAKLPVYALISAAFFPGYSALVMIILYLSGIVIGILSGLLFKNLLFRGNSVPFIMELPNYRLPSPKSVVILMWEKSKDFITRAFTIIFIASLVIWFLQTFDFRFNVADSINSSMLAVMAGKISFIFAPLGFDDFRAVTALISGFTAKEAVVSTLAVLTGSSSSTLSGSLGGIFTQLSAMSFLFFTLLYTPCIAAVAAVKRELGTLWSAVMIIFQIASAWIISFAVYQLGILFFR